MNKITNSETFESLFPTMEELKNEQRLEEINEELEMLEDAYGNFLGQDIKTVQKIEKDIEKLNNEKNKIKRSKS